MRKSLKRLSAGLLIAVLLTALLPAVNTEAAALKKPGNARFMKWNDNAFTSASIAWNKVAGADCYEVKCTWTNNTHDAFSDQRYVDHYFNSVKISGLNYQHVYQARVRACRMNSSGKVTAASAWSNIIFITPWPKNVSGTVTKKSAVTLKWNIIYGSNGYNIFMTTNPAAAWHWRYSTSTNAAATSASFSQFRGSNFKKYQNYYVRVITRRKRNGVFCTVPEPYKKYYQFKFTGK